MKTNVFTPAVVLLLVVLITASCRSSRPSTGGGYPNGKSGQVYKGGHLPPGQAKKLYGDKSAKKYAPGQRKKRKG
jgi:hypothetical protein